MFEFVTETIIMRLLCIWLWIRQVLSTAWIRVISVCRCFDVGCLVAWQHVTFPFVRYHRAGAFVFCSWGMMRCGEACKNSTATSPFCHQKLLSGRLPHTLTFQACFRAHTTSLTWSLSFLWCHHDIGLRLLSETRLRHTKSQHRTGFTGHCGLTSTPK